MCSVVDPLYVKHLVRCLEGSRMLTLGAGERSMYIGVGVISAQRWQVKMWEPRAIPCVGRGCYARMVLPAARAGACGETMVSGSQGEKVCQEEEVVGSLAPARRPCGMWS